MSFKLADEILRNFATLTMRRFDVKQLRYSRVYVRLAELLPMIS